MESIDPQRYFNGQGFVGGRGGAPSARRNERAYRDLCGKCGARRVDRQIGLEPTPDLFVAEMVRVFREVRRVLRNDGCLWLNMGDSFSSGGRTTQAEPAGDVGQPGMRDGRAIRPPVCDGLRPKNLLGMPWRVAFALQADGWIIRQDIIWSKANPMPESVTDRPTKSHEYLFLLAKSERYFWDAEAVREKAEYGRRVWKDDHYKNGDIRIHHKGTTTGGDPEAGRNIRSVWTIPTESFIGAHFATFPRRLVEPCIRAGTSARGCCPACGAPWVRVVEDSPEYAAIKQRRRGTPGYESRGLEAGNRFGSETGGLVKSQVILGWRASCPCDAGEPVPATVLDPFIGSGTALVVAEALGRRGVGLDLSRDYLTMAARRLSRPHARIPRPGRDGAMPLFEGSET